MPDLIHIYHNNQQEGPYSSDQLHDMIAKGTVTPVTLAWTEGMSAWAPLNTIVACAERTFPTVPPPPPAAYAAPQPSETSPPVDVPGPKGVGGWLLFFCVGLTILGPLYNLGQISMNWEQAQPAFAQFPSLKTAVMWENAGTVALIIYGFIVGCMIWGGNPNGREIAKKFLLIRLFGFIGIEFIAVVIMGDMPTEVVASVIGAAVGAIFGNLISFLIWWFYFKKSKRVRNTYGAN
jgi:hypothetical protein